MACAEMAAVSFWLHCSVRLAAFALLISESVEYPVRALSAWYVASGPEADGLDELQPARVATTTSRVPTIANGATRRPLPRGPDDRLRLM